ncbi:MAG: hypothetical protein LH650_16760 [Chloroflexi bacterium]|nr:hypothetical protein [Chloroflexota bacterium]
MTLIPSRRSARSAIAATAIVAVAASGALAQSPAASPSAAPTPVLSLAPGELGLRGTIIGHFDDGVTEAWAHRDKVDMSMDLVLVLSPSQGRADGTFQISGETTLDCEYADSGAGEVNWDSNSSQPFAADGNAWARVSLRMDDPRYVIPDLTGFTLYAGAGIRRWGGTCGHTNGPVFDASPQISVSFPVCGTIDVMRVDERTWRGTCTTDSNYDHSTVTAHFEALP